MTVKCVLLLILSSFHLFQTHVDILQTACVNFTRLTTSVHSETKMNYFEVKGHRRHLPKMHFSGEGISSAGASLNEAPRSDFFQSSPSIV